MYYAVEYTRADGETVRIDYTSEQDMRKDVERRLRIEYATKARIRVEDVEE